MSLTVLTVDDSRTMRDMLRLALAQVGFNVLQAEDGVHGLEVLVAQDRPDVIVTDINMPRMDGYGFIEGVRAKGFGGYLKSWIPDGTPPALRPGIFVIEVISQFVRIISLSVRLFANILAGHLLILFMGGGLVVLMGLAALGVLTLPVAVAFFLFEVVLISTLQAFIFATLTSIYFGEAVAEQH